MNYRHGFHAGNFGDVLKHVTLVELLRLLTAKDKKLFVLDTHAGAGGYDLAGAQARRTGEAEAGILRLMAASPSGMPPAVARYLAAVAAYERKFGATAGLLRHYPGSPRLVRAGLRPGDRLVACELHPQEALALKREFAGDRAVDVRQIDGYGALKSLLPPAERRGLVLIDPPFEAADEFERLSRALRQALRRFATGCFAIWYPIKDDAAVAKFAEALLPLKALVLELRLPIPSGSDQLGAASGSDRLGAASGSDRLGAASGSDRLGACRVAVINPPWKFEEAMRQALPWIAGRLGGDAATVPVSATF